LADQLSDLDSELSTLTPKRAGDSRRAQLYALLLLVLAAVCAYLILERNEHLSTIQQIPSLENAIEILKEQRDQWKAETTGISDTLVELSDRAVAEAEMCHSRGDRRQALGNLDQAAQLLNLAIRLGECGCASRPSGRVKKRIMNMVNLMQPTAEELPLLDTIHKWQAAQPEPTTAESTEDE